MVQYRRSRTRGGTYFFTVALQDRKERYLVTHAAVFRAALAKARARMPFRIDAIALLPDHLHTVWTLPPGDDDYPGRWRAVKAGFTRGLLEKGVPLSRRRDGSYRLWQRRYWEHTIRDAADLRAHVDYLHFNPVKHGYVVRAADWPLSSFHHFVRRGIYTADWGWSEPAEGSWEWGE